MATNQVFEHGDQFVVVATEPATPQSGDPILVGQLPGVALTDENADGEVTAKFNGVWEFPVEAEGGAITPGAIVYYDAADDALNNSSSGNIRFGYALDEVDNAATATIRVKIGY
jgi:predicted RecA/RadA family phage recombinase